MTKDVFIFNAFGYEHPDNRVFAFLKYIPAEFRRLFNVDFLERTWTYGRTQLFRAEKLYTAENYQAYLQTFRNTFPDFAYFCPFRKKEVIAAPLASIKKVYVPGECLRSLQKRRNRDSLQEATLDLIKLLSTESRVSEDDFGVHGSVALEMHTSASDIDIVVYGARNFRILEGTVDKLVKAGVLNYQSNNRLDAARRFKGRYKNRVFMYNAVRKPEEINVKYGAVTYSAIDPVRFICTVKDDGEAMFRPATYGIENYEPCDEGSDLETKNLPSKLVSMVGCYRNVAKHGDKIKVSGMLEHADNLETSKSFNQVIVGTGTSEEEGICPA